MTVRDRPGANSPIGVTPTTVSMATLPPSTSVMQPSTVMKPAHDRKMPPSDARSAVAAAVVGIGHERRHRPVQPGGSLRTV